MTSKELALWRVTWRVCAECNKRPLQSLLYSYFSIKILFQIFSIFSRNTLFSGRLSASSHSNRECPTSSGAFIKKLVHKIVFTLASEQPVPTWLFDQFMITLNGLPTIFCYVNNLKSQSILSGHFPAMKSQHRSTSCLIVVFHLRYGCSNIIKAAKSFAGGGISIQSTSVIASDTRVCFYEITNNRGRITNCLRNTCVLIFGEQSSLNLADLILRDRSKTDDGSRRAR